MIRFGIRAIPIVGMVNLFVGMIVAVSMSEMLIQLNAVSRTAQIVAKPLPAHVWCMKSTLVILLASAMAVCGQNYHGDTIARRHSAASS